MYSLRIKPQYIKHLFELREYADEGPIAAQINRSIESYIKSKHDELQEIERELERQELENLNER